jgi:probable HAF family extracellular repeat protein
MAIVLSRTSAVLLAAVVSCSAAQAQTMYRVTRVSLGSLDSLTDKGKYVLRNSAAEYSLCTPKRCHELPRQPRVEWLAVNDSRVVMGSVEHGSLSSIVRKWPGQPLLERFRASAPNWPGHAIAPDGTMVGVDRNRDAVMITDTLHVLPGLAGQGGGATAINSAHVVVGYSATQDAMHATMWVGGVPQDLGTLPGHKYSEAYALNDANFAVGYSYVPGLRPQAVRFAPGSTPTELVAPANIAESRAYAINNRGDIVGTMWDKDTNGGLGFVVENDKLVALNDRLRAEDRGHYDVWYAVGINKRGQIAAWGWTGTGSEALLLDPIQ